MASRYLQLSKLILLLISTALFSCKKSSNGDNPPAPGPEQATISNVQPKNPKAGEILTITGFGFGTTANDIKVTVGGKDATIVAVTATEIKATLGAGTTAGDIAVTIKGKAAVNKDPQGTAISPAAPTPTLMAITPASGKAGDVITLTGTNFSTQLTENKVLFSTATAGSTVQATVKTATATTLTVEVPATAATGNISVNVGTVAAVAANGFTPAFTVNATSGGTGGGVGYIKVVSGNLGFSKIGSAANEIGTMYYDKVKNYIYYSDYTLATPNGNKVYKLDPGGNNPPVTLTNDARITNIVKIATDASGNVYVLRAESAPSKLSLYKITPDGSTVTEVLTNFNSVANNSGKYFLFINAGNEICLRPDFKITQSGTIVTTGTTLPGLQQTTEGAVYNSNYAYLAYTTDNSGYANTCVFTKWNLNDGTTANTGFSLQSLFGTDDAERVKSTVPVGYLRYAVDDSENFYALIDRSYSSGSLSKTWAIVKTKNGVSSGTTLGTFQVSFPTPDLNEIAGTVTFVSDSRGNFYIKANRTDILRITQ